MSDKAAMLKSDLLRLPESERWDILDALYESLPRPRGILPEDEAQLSEELDRRRSEYESGVDPGIHAAEFFHKLRGNRS